MYDDDDLDAAVAAGVLAERDVLAFREHVAGRRALPVADEEHFRLIGGFNDVFVVIACALLLGSVAWLGSSVTPWLGGAAEAAVAWGLAIAFTLRRRMALPSIVLLLAFVGGVFAAGVLLARKLGLAGELSMVAASALAAAAAWGHWRRFRVPITVAAGVAALIALAVSTLLSAFPSWSRGLNVILFAAGILVFIVAMRWDLSDPGRRTRRADTAFWLHLLAAPLLVHPVFSSLGLGGRDGTHLLQAGAVLAMYLVLAFVSLAIDRRALMVSALAYVLVAFGTLFKEHGAVSIGFALAALVIGSALLLLSAYWHASRAAVMARLPATWRERLAPLH